MFATRLILALGFAIGLAPGALAQPASVDEEPKAKTPATIGRIVELSNPIGPTDIAAVKSALLELRTTAASDNADATLILALPAGSSQYHYVLALAKELTDSASANVRTVCWVSESVTGYNAIIPFACREVVLHPDAEIGDFGRGESLDDDELAFVKRLASKRGHPLRPAALVEAMSDPAVALSQIDLEKPAGEGGVRTERRLVLPDDIKAMRDAGVAILDRRVVSEAGTPLLVAADEARRLGILTNQFAGSMQEVADLYSIPQGAARIAANSQPPTKVRLIPIRGEIEPLLGSFVSRQIARAVAQGADLIIFEVESPGGYKSISMELADQIAALSDRDIRTVAWIPKQAISGAAIVSLGCDEIILAPTALIGDAGAIFMNEGAFERVPEKFVSPFRLEMANLAERKGRPPALLMAMVDRNLEVFEVTHANDGRTWYMSDDEIHEAGGEWIKGRLVPESRKEDLLLTADGQRAHELKIAEPPAPDFEAVKARLGIEPDVNIREVERTWVDDAVVVLNSPFIVGLLFFAGIMCIYLELHTMTGLFGIGAIISFALFFWSKMLGGTAGSLEVVLFILGFSLIACEIFVIPGFGVFGVTGFLLVVGSLVMASQTFQGFSTEESLAASGKTLGQLLGAIVGVIVAGSLLSRYLPKIPLFADMVLAPPGASLPNGTDVRLRPELTNSAAPSDGPAIGSQGVTATTLRPAGKVRIAGALYDVVSEGAFIESGKPIEVIDIEGIRVIVRELA